MIILSRMRTLCENEMNDTLELTLQSINLQSIGENLLDDNVDPNDNIVTDIENLLSIAQYIETDTTMESPISDTLYDSLHAKYNELTGGKSIVGTHSNTTKLTKQHRYPELRGSLDKVHFIYKDQVPKKDSRKSFQEWLQNVINKCQPIHGNIEISPNYKYDGLSGVFECTGSTINSVLTRKDVDTNEGVDITYIFKNKDISELIPSELIGSNIEYGLKTEMLVTESSYTNFSRQQQTTNSRVPKNTRSAASMIINTSEDEFIPEWSDYITLKALQLSSTVKINPDKNWKYLCEMDGRYQYIIDEGDHCIIDSNNISSYLETLNKTIELYQSLSWYHGIPTDGVVFTLWNEDMVNILGRSNNINKFQIAYKISAGTMKTKLKNVTFPIGPLSTITPLAEVEPVVIMGNTITNVTLSNYDKLERLNLHIGDEVIVNYDIIPTLYKDDTCQSMPGEQIHGPLNCPSCGEPLSVNKIIVRCTNRLCPSKKVGIIYNYIRKMDISSIGLATVTDFVNNGFLINIADLYTLEKFKKDIIALSGYGEKSFNNIIKSIRSKNEVYPHELLGSIGIPDIGRTIMKNICRVIPFTRLLDIDDPDELTKINGIGWINANKIINGLQENKLLITQLSHFLVIKEYTDTSSNVVLFTGVRDKEFAKFLESTGNYEIANGYSSKVNIVVTRDDSYTSSKIAAAKKDNKTIISLDDFKKKLNYN